MHCIITPTPVQIDMSNIIDQAQKIIKANGFEGSKFCARAQMAIEPSLLLVHLKY